MIYTGKTITAPVWNNVYRWYGAGCRACTNLCFLFRFLRGKIEGHGFVFEIALVRAIAKRLVLRLAATAQGNHRASTQSIYISVLVHDLEFAFHAYRSVVVNGEFRRRHVFVLPAKIGREGKLIS